MLMVKLIATIASNCTGTIPRCSPMGMRNEARMIIAARLSITQPMTSRARFIAARSGAGVSSRYSPEPEHEGRDRRDDGGLGRGDDAAIDAAQNEDRPGKRPFFRLKAAQTSARLALGRGAIPCLRAW